MKQAVEERFTLDVLKNYTPVDSYYKRVKKIEDDPEFDTKKARKKLRRYFEGRDHALCKVMQILLKDDTQVCKQFVENEAFKRFVSDMVYDHPSGQLQRGVTTLWMGVWGLCKQVW